MSIKIKLFSLFVVLLLVCGACSITIAQPTSSGGTEAISEINEQTTMTTGVPDGPYTPIETMTKVGEISTADGGSKPLSYSISVPKLLDDRASGLNADYAETLRYYVEDYAPMLAVDSGALTGDDIHTLSLVFDYTVKHNDGETISIVFREAVQIGDLYTETYYADTYSLSLGRKLTLQDVIMSEESAYQIAAKEIAKRIDEDRHGDNVWGFYDDVDENTVAMYLNDYSFYLNESGSVVLIINPAFISECTSGLCEFPLDE